MHAWKGLAHVRHAAFEYIEVYYNRTRIQKVLGYCHRPSLNSELTPEWRKWHNIVSSKSVGVQTVMPAAEVITSYHDLWHVEQSFRMSKTDLAAGPCSPAPATPSKRT